MSGVFPCSRVRDLAGQRRHPRSFRLRRPAPPPRGSGLRSHAGGVARSAHTDGRQAESGVRRFPSLSIQRRLRGPGRESEYRMGSVRGAWLGGADRAAASALATLSATASESIPAASHQPHYELTISEGGEPARHSRPVPRRSGETHLTASEDASRWRADVRPGRGQPGGWCG